MCRGMHGKGTMRCAPEWQAGGDHAQCAALPGTPQQNAPGWISNRNALFSQLRRPEVAIERREHLLSSETLTRRQLSPCLSSPGLFSVGAEQDGDCSLFLFSRHQPCGIKHNQPCLVASFNLRHRPEGSMSITLGVWT